MSKTIGHLKAAGFILLVIAVSAFLLKMFPGVRAKIAPWLTY